MPLYGGVCPYDPEHSPIPEDLEDPDIPEWYASWLHNYQMRDRWPVVIFSAVPAIPEVSAIEALEPSQAMSGLIEDLAAMEFGARSAAAADRWAVFFLDQGFEGFEVSSVSSSRRRGRSGRGARVAATEALDAIVTIGAACSGTPAADKVAAPVLRKGRGRGRSAAAAAPAPAPAPDAPAPPQPATTLAAGAPARATRGAEALPRSIAEWLRDVDETGCLEVYQEVLGAHVQSPEELVEAYAAHGPDGRRNRLSSDFFQAVGVKKVGHKRLFEKWFLEHL